MCLVAVTMRTGSYLVQWYCSHLIGLYDVSNLEVRERVQRQATLLALADLAHFILVMPQRANLTVVMAH